MSHLGSFYGGIPWINQTMPRNGTHNLHLVVIDCVCIKVRASGADHPFNNSRR